MSTSYESADTSCHEHCQTPQGLNDIKCLTGWLRSQIGKRVMVTFIIGQNTVIDRQGILTAVGINYILLREAETDDIVACDMESIRFVRVFH